jgi:hypothetical protein
VPRATRCIEKPTATILPCARKGLSARVRLAIQRDPPILSSDALAYVPKRGGRGESAPSASTDHQFDTKLAQSLATLAAVRSVAALSAQPWLLLAAVALFFSRAQPAVSRLLAEERVC